MKTYDGAKLVQQRLDQVYSKFPEGSLSAREILATIPVSDWKKKDDLAYQINSKITQAIFKKAEEFVKRGDKTFNSDSSKELTAAVLKAFK
jgi:GH25 family lysozyme M1 (1,4-beta-N-acetylmuramidase)